MRAAGRHREHHQHHPVPSGLGAGRANPLCLEAERAGAGWGAAAVTRTGGGEAGGRGAERAARPVWVARGHR